MKQFQGKVRLTFLGKFGKQIFFQENLTLETHRYKRLFFFDNEPLFLIFSLRGPLIHSILQFASPSLSRACQFQSQCRLTPLSIRPGSTMRVPELFSPGCGYKPTSGGLLRFRACGLLWPYKILAIFFG